MDAVAEQFEVDRLLGMGVLERIPHATDISGFRWLSTRMVNSWRVKPRPGHGDSFLRRARFVARESRWMSSEPDDAVFAPASSNVLTRVLPAQCHQAQPWHALSLDVTDAYLTVEQKVPTIVCAVIAGTHHWFKLLKTLPGERTGAKDWLEDFHDYLQQAIAIEPLVQAPALFRIPVSRDGGGTGAGGGGLSHVDDVFAVASKAALAALCDAVTSKYKCSIKHFASGWGRGFLSQAQAYVAEQWHFWNPAES